MDNNRLTTTNIGVEQLKHLKKISDHLGLKQVEFINASVDYFRKTGIDPSQEIYSPREEINKLTKRVEEVIRFLQVHEKNKLSPLLERLLLLERQLSENYSNIVSKEDIQSISEKIVELSEKFSKTQYHIETLTPNTLIKITKAVEVLIGGQKKTELLLSLLFQALNNKPITGKFKEIDIQNFEDAIRKI